MRLCIIGERFSSMSGCARRHDSGQSRGTGLPYQLLPAIPSPRCDRECDQSGRMHTCARFGHILGLEIRFEGVQPRPSRNWVRGEFRWLVSLRVRYRQALFSFSDEVTDLTLSQPMVTRRPLLTRFLRVRGKRRTELRLSGG